jgi:hypothetical protein
MSHCVIDLHASSGVALDRECLLAFTPESFCSDNPADRQIARAMMFAAQAHCCLLCHSEQASHLAFKEHVSGYFLVVFTLCERCAGGDPDHLDAKVLRALAREEDAAESRCLVDEGIRIWLHGTQERGTQE